MKPCTKCLEIKPLTEFYKEKRFAVGYQSRCKMCMREHKRQARQTSPNADRDYYLKNKERLLTQKKAKYVTDEEHRKRAQAQMKKYYAQNRERIKARVKANAALRSDELVQYRKEYRARPGNREKDNASSRKYRANPANKQGLAYRQMQYTYRKLNATGLASKAQLKARWDYYGGKCWICKLPAREMDHVKPLTKGGSNWPANLRPICRPCNARKSNTWPYTLTNSL
jgi:5-methylcytosine-specific restriction endonuclease McrA